MKNGYIALQFGNATLPVVVLKSAAGFYLGTTQNGVPFTRESQEYFPSQEAAEAALQSGNWTQREFP